MLAIDPCKESGKFCFIAAKRGRRAGWKDAKGEVQYKKWFKYATVGGSFWEDTDPETLGGKHTEDTLYDLMPHGVAIPKDAFIEIARSAGMSKNRANNLLSKLIFDGRIAEDRLPRAGTNPQRIIRRADTDPLPNAIVDKTPKKPTKLVRRGGTVVEVLTPDAAMVTSVVLTEVEN
jgi:hypothetical protein